MQRISSNFTLFLKLFLPTVWIVFFTVFTVALFLVDEQELPFLTSPIFKYSFLVGYLLFFALIYFTLMQLKRVELGSDCYYVTNYFKTYRLIYDDIESIHIIPLGRLQVITIRLKAKGSFGKKIQFLANRQLYELFMASNPEVNAIFSKLYKS
jgi:hypothetical protein